MSPTYENAVNLFSKRMLSRLDSNSGKGHWSECEDSYLIRRLLEEVGELVESIIDKEHTSLIVREAADVANFAMMLADNRAKTDYTVKPEYRYYDT